MGALARVAGCVAMLGLVACAAIAGLEAPGTGIDSVSTSDGDASSSPSSDASATQSADGSESNDAASSTDASTKADADAAPPPPCTKTQLGGSCSTGSTCCSSKCNEAKVCAGDCRSTGSTCDLFANAPCCVDLYCFSGLCAPCIGPGGTPTDKLGGGGNNKSCCSRTIAADGKCQ